MTGNSVALDVHINIQSDMVNKMLYDERKISYDTWCDVKDNVSLVVTTSVSGNTEETLHILNLALKRGCKTASFSTGGKMQEFCIKHNIHHGKINQMHSPRASFAVFLFSL